MEWVLRSPQIHSTFGNLGFSHADGYHVNENCNAALETILHNILTEDKYLRLYRRNIRLCQNIQKDLIPLLIHTKEDKTIELITRILVNLTIPIECLLSIDVMSKSDFGRHTIFEINDLLATTKSACTDHKATRVVIEFLKKNVDGEQKGKLSEEQCTNINNSLLLLRNILHIPEETGGQSPNYNGSSHTVQNQILWNIFSQSIDKILIKLMTIPDATRWGVTMVQLIALLYKDQHVGTLHKLLNLWLEASLSDSSEDNESNTSPPDRAGSEDSSPTLTSDPTSDSSDTGGSGKSNDENNKGWDNNETFQPPQQHNGKVDNKAPNDNNNENDDNEMPPADANRNDTNKTDQNKSEKKTVISENSDCGYGTQIENQESISTSSNEDEVPNKKPVHQKPHNPKQRINTKVRLGNTIQDRKRKKIVKRGKANIINVQGLTHKTPTDDDISNVLKEFTVDFLLKGYNALVQTLHSEILTNLQLEIDTSHFFWLVTYFLKFATQIELDLENVCSVISYDIMSYLTAEGVNLCEQFELAIKLDGKDLTPTIRRLHLVVTAIREFVQAIEVYKKFSHLNKDDHELLIDLQIKMCETEELRSLLVLLLRCYNPKYHSKQYLQDLIVTNHMLLMFLDNVMKLPEYTCSTNMMDHIQQFATSEIMYKYGLLLEDYAGNGEFVNDCIFTLMHHVVGEVGSLITLFQPKILKTFTSIWKSEFEICDDWSDLIEYVINTFIKKPHTLHSSANICLAMETFDEDKVFVKPENPEPNEAETKKKSGSISSNTAKEKWTEDELSSLSWTYMQCNTMSDVIGEMNKLFKENGINKSRDSVIREIFKQNIIAKDEFEKYIKGESDRNMKSVQANKEQRDDEIGKLCEQLTQDGKVKFLDWLQKVLLETCYVKLYFEKKCKEDLIENNDSKLLNFELFRKKCNALPVMSPVSYHSLLYRQSVPLVPWNCNQAAICKDLKFLQLLHKLGFHMPVDSGKVFIRIPNFWTADFLYDVACKIAPVDPSKLKFSIDELSTSSIVKFKSEYTLAMIPDMPKNIIILDSPENFYQIHKQKLATMVNYTPMPGTSFNTEEEEIDKQNWLKVVQKSQEYKLTLNLDRIAENEGVEEDVVMSGVNNYHPTDSISNAASSGIMGARFTTTPFMIPPTIMSVKQEDTTSVYNVPLNDPEYYNNSVCETASVASDLTRMYVSDEDEKPEIIIRPPIDITALSDHSDSDIADQED